MTWAIHQNNENLFGNLWEMYYTKQGKTNNDEIPAYLLNSPKQKEISKQFHRTMVQETTAISIKHED